MSPERANASTVRERGVTAGPPGTSLCDTGHADPVQPGAAPSERTTVLTTARARLTTWLPEDLADLCRLHSDPRAMRYMRSGVEDEDRTRARLATWLREQAERGWTKWRAEDRTGALIGRAGFSPSTDGRRRELGYLVAPAQWGRGLATELARALVRWHAEHPGGVDPQLGAFAFADNLASRRVLEKVGFTLVGTSDDRGAVITRYLRR
jgi:RimJ/RimL family protein N-acetyltransferase